MRKLFFFQSDTKQKYAREAGIADPNAPEFYIQNNIFGLLMASVVGSPSNLKWVEYSEKKFEADMHAASFRSEMADKLFQEYVDRVVSRAVNRCSRCQEYRLAVMQAHLR